METKTKSMTTLDKIRRLLSLAQSNNPHEAASAAAEAQRLMIKHGIESAELSPQEVDQLLVDTGSMNVWYRCLATYVAKATFCTIYGLTGAGAGKSTGKVAVCGYKDDVAVAAVLLAWLSSEVNRLCELEWAPLRSSGLSANAWKKSFRLSAVVTIGQRLAAERAIAVAELAETTAPSQSWSNSTNALVRLDTYTAEAALAVRKFLAKDGTKLRESSPAGPKDGNAFAQGCTAGYGVGLTPPKRALHN